MSGYMIVIDGGTTHTRAMLFDRSLNCVDIVKQNIGMRNAAIESNTNILENNIHDAIEKLYHQNGICNEDVERIIACGGLSVDIGIANVPYYPLPAGKKELKEAMQIQLIPNISDKPIYFLTGVFADEVELDSENIEHMDAMKGEEAEAMAVLETMETGNKHIFVFPGSHTKIVLIDEKGQITATLSCLTGEILAAISKHTFIADAVGASFLQPEDYNRNIMLAGYRVAKKSSLTRAVFSTRMYNRFVDKRHTHAQNFLLGALVQSDVQAICSSKIFGNLRDVPIHVIGTNPFRCAFVDSIREEDCFSQVKEYAVDSHVPLTGVGACLIARHEDK